MVIRASDDGSRRSGGKPKYRLIDLFSGAGGFTLGFTRTGRFEPVFSNDFNAWAARTYDTNFGEHCRVGDINSILEDPKSRIPAADIVIGGPPCQGFSLLNKNKARDPRRQLWRAYMEVVRRAKPAAWVMENVPELLKSDEFVDIAREAKRLGYTYTAAVLNAADYGVPQRRRRAFIVAVREGDPRLPKPTHRSPALTEDIFARNLPPWRSVGDAICDLPEPVGTEIRRNEPPPLDLHFGRTPTAKSLERYRCIPEGGNRVDLQERRPDILPDCWKDKKGGTDLFGRLWWDRPAFTIRTEFFKPEKGRYLHPRQHRPITHREAARLMSFPDDFTFLGTKIEVARQIGNAVPPLLAQCIAKTVLQHLDAARNSGVKHRREHPATQSPTQQAASISRERNVRVSKSCASASSLPRS